MHDDLGLCAVLEPAPLAPGVVVIGPASPEMREFPSIPAAPRDFPASSAPLVKRSMVTSTRFELKVI
jgi:hypothetical protein